MTAILKAGVGFERVTVIAVGIASRYQQGAVADHVGKFVPHPFGIARVFKTASQPLGDPQPLLDGRQQQDTAIRSQPSAVETDVHRLAGDG